MKKSTKRFVLSTEAKNSHGFRVRTAGIDLSQYERNPIMLFMHKRPTEQRADQILPLGNFVDLEVRNSQLTGVPCFDESDDFAMKIYHKVENGTIRMASVGLDPDVWEKTDDELWLEKSILNEVSICDIGSNSDALAYDVVLYDKKGEMITLTDQYIQLALSKNQNSYMELITLVDSKTREHLKLTDKSTNEEIMKEMTKAVELSISQGAQIINLTKERDEAKEAESKAKEELETAKSENADKEIVALVSKAVIDRKITKAEKDHYISLAKHDKETVQKIFDGMKANPSIKEMTKTESAGLDEATLKMSWDELDKSNLLALVKEKAPEVFEQKFQQKFPGKELV